MIRIGTAGWSYPSGEGKWTGVFYPAGKKVDALEFYSQFFDTVEVNSTFYRPAPPPVVRSWALKTPAGFRFAVKLYQKFTHPKMFEESTGDEANVERKDFEQFKRTLDPLAEHGKLGPLLAQFPPSFKQSDGTLAYLDELARSFGEYRLVVELRHESWTDDEATATLLAERGVSWALIDEPKFSSSIGQVPITAPVGYFRFHGRNYQDWWRGDRESRYNYLYSPQEQSQLAHEVLQVAEVAADTHVAYNNHYRAKAVANALQLKLMLGQEIPDDIPAPLLAEYPDLADLLHRESAEGRT